MADVLYRTLFKNRYQNEKKLHTEYEILLRKLTDHEEKLSLLQQELARQEDGKLNLQNDLNQAESRIQELEKKNQGLQTYVTNLENDGDRLAHIAAAADSIKCGIQDPFVVFEADLVISHASREFYTLIGRSPDQPLNGERLTEILRRKEIVRAISGIAEEKTPLFNFEQKIMRPDGEPVTILINGAPRLSSTGEMMGGFLLIRDITTLRLLTNRLGEISRGYLAAERVDEAIRQGTPMNQAIEDVLRMSATSQSDPIVRDLEEAFKAMLDTLLRVTMQSRRIAADQLDDAILSDRIPGDLGEAMATMNANLQQFGERIREIAEGNLRVTTDGIDAGGTLGGSVSALIQNTNAVCRVAEAIASCDLTVNPEGLPGDLGQVFGTMHQELIALVRQIQLNISQVLTSSTELIACSEQLSRRTEIENQQLTDAVAAITELSASIEQIATTICQLQQSSQQANEVATQGGSIVNQTISGMKSVDQAIQRTGDNLQRLGESSKRIGEIVTVITSIADKTNLLALNAAIEAARAGEHGRGFAVVAVEVKKLAENSARSAKEIDNLVLSIREDLERTIHSMEDEVTQIAIGMKHAEDSGVSLQEIIRIVGQTARSIDEINQALSQQAIVSSELSQNVEKIQEMANETMMATQEYTRQGKDLNQLGENLHERLAQFTLPG